MRTKRYQDGSIASHPLSEITFRDARNMLMWGDHKAVFMEQVSGFDKPERAGDLLATPMRRLGGLWLWLYAYDMMFPKCICRLL